MNVSLTKELEKYIASRVKTGMFGSASEVVREALRLLRERDAKLEYLRREIDIGLEDLRQGRVVEDSDGLAERIKRDGRRRLAAERKKSG